eukprot:scaffold40877_cov39-Tisochrysis_lutea.AAC.1
MSYESFIDDASISTMPLEKSHHEQWVTARTHHSELAQRCAYPPTCSIPPHRVFGIGLRVADVVCGVHLGDRDAIELAQVFSDLNLVHLWRDEELEDGPLEPLGRVQARLANVPDDPVGEEADGTSARLNVPNRSAASRAHRAAALEEHIPGTHRACRASAAAQLLSLSARSMSTLDFALTH